MTSSRKPAPMAVYCNKLKPFRDPVKKKIISLIRDICHAEKANVHELCFTYVDNDFIRDLNQRYRHKNRPTDVIAFTLSEPNKPLVGDVYISVEQARLQAVDYGVPSETEIVRLTVHGLLHVLGYDHEIESDRKIMTAKEDQWVADYKLTGSSI